jgi:hypothetical protein
LRTDIPSLPFANYYHLAACVADKSVGQGAAHGSAQKSPAFVGRGEIG